MLKRTNEGEASARRMRRLALTATVLLGMVATLWPRPAAADTGGLCAAAPRVGECAVATTSNAKLTGGPGNPYSTLQWKWKGAIALAADFGAPLNDTDYIFCLYDGATLKSEMYVPASPFWKAIKTGFKYADKEGLSDGATAALLSTNAKGKGQLQLKGKGIALPMPSLPLSGSAITIQMNNRLFDPVTGALTSKCWTATYPAAAQKNGDTKFTGKCSNPKLPCTP